MWRREGQISMRIIERRKTLSRKQGVNFPTSLRPADVPFCPQGKLAGIPNKGLRGSGSAMLPFLRICFQAVPFVQHFFKLVFLRIDTSASHLVVSHLVQSLHPILLAALSDFVTGHSVDFLHIVQPVGQPHLNIKLAHPR